MKCIIIYGSHHHGSTRKLAQAISGQYGAVLWDAEQGEVPDLSEYDLIGFASGIDFGRFYPAVTELARSLPEGKAVWAMFTCARDNGKYGREIQEIARQRRCTYLGKFGCRGFNTYGPWKLIGGMNHGHPSPAEVEDALRFYGKLLGKACSSLQQPDILL